VKVTPGDNSFLKSIIYITVTLTKLIILKCVDERVRLILLQNVMSQYESFIHQSLTSPYSVSCLNYIISIFLFFLNI